ncbi:hypothetical protein K505DRAFT_353801 [Melanomma pulvis-pyrius CBS 109.77]|uniref:C2H2-type domain-containing protein n=1 Tax=Melanomma pulvis-pyrius CBS 109.77 TaxID=1314802 RepID=A0A6A6WTP9_9PLEO|nr:hypothetical protein K505DRAFT_353801 [Melanomma pulvis-pyrius CBS 109.77]
MQSLSPGNWTNADPASRIPNFRTTKQHSWNGSSAAALGIAYDNERFRQFFHRYNVAEIMRGYELAQDADLFAIARKYRDIDLRLLLKFREDDALEFFEELKRCRGSDILECREAIVGTSQSVAKHQASLLDLSHRSHSYRLSNASRDSGYESRPSSEIDGSMGFSLAYNTATPTPPHYSSSSTQGVLHEHPLPITNSFPSAPQPNLLGETHRSEHINNACFPHSPQWPPTESTASSPLDTAKPNRPRLFECMYCAHGFVRYGDCLNHEEKNHSQRKEWICPHCQVQSKTKAGHDRHHRNHGCQQCTEPEEVVILSGPKTASACYYCGALFEGTDCFASRANHVKMAHYKGDVPKTRVDMDHSRMISSLLSQRGLSSSWELFMKRKPNVELSWTAENSRELVDALEFGEYPNGMLNQIQRIYDLADKVENPPRSLPTETSGDGQIDQQIGIPKSLEVPAVFTRPRTTGARLTDLDDGFMDSSRTSSAKTSDPRLKKVVTSPLSGEGQSYTDLVNGFDSSHDHSSSMRLAHQPSPQFRDDVFMGSRRHTHDSSDIMDISQGSGSTSLTPAPRDPTPPSGSWAFWEMDDPLMRMEDIMTQQILVSSQPSSNVPAYTPPGWEHALPPSIQMAANTPPAPLGGALPWPPHRRSPRN